MNSFETIWFSLDFPACGSSQRTDEKTKLLVTSASVCTANERLMKVKQMWLKVTFCRSDTICRRFGGKHMESQLPITDLGLQQWPKQLRKKNTKGDYADLLDLLSSKVKHKDMVHSVNVRLSGWFSFIAATGINAKRWGNVDNWSTKANWLNKLHIGISAQQIISMLHFK